MHKISAREDCFNGKHLKNKRNFFTPAKIKLTTSELDIPELQWTEIKDQSPGLNDAP